MLNKLLNKIAIPVLIVLLIMGWFEYKKYINFKETVIMSPVLKEGEREKFTLEGKTLTKIRKRTKADGTVEQVVERVEGVRRVAITIKDDGTVEVYARSHGPIFEPGVALGYAGSSTRLGIDAQLYYWRQFSVGVGVNIDTKEWRDVRFHGALHYGLPIKKLDNTSLYLGADNKFDVAVGVRVKF